MSARVAIVVGAGGELGRATVQKLATAGFTVVGVDRNEEGLKELPDGIGYEVGDATDPAVARSVVEQIAARVGPPEVLVNTIGTYPWVSARPGVAPARDPGERRRTASARHGQDPAVPACRPAGARGLTQGGR